ncbi:hypothetical protein K402DRAFT_313042, partial [Aulographum hederae CBS 113979]
RRFINTVATSLLFVCPLIAALPPRRFNIGTAFLGVLFVGSANHLVVDRTQKNMLQHAGLGYLWPTTEEDRMGYRNNWQRKRMEEEKRMMEEGKGYSDIIFNQIWEVVNWDKKGKKSDDD